MPLSKEDECRLVREAQEGDVQSREELLIEHLGLVKSIARKLCDPERNPELFENLVPEGALALSDKVIDRFDLDKGVRFATYAFWRIMGAMLNYIGREYGGGVPIPRPLRDLARKVGKVHDKFRQKFHRKPTVEEIAKAVPVYDKLKKSLKREPTVEEILKAMSEPIEKLEDEKVEEALNLLALEIVSLEELMEPTEEGKVAWEPPSQEPSPPQHTITQEQDETLAIAITMLRPAFAAVLVLSYFDSLTVEEIAQALNKPLGTVKVWKMRAEKQLEHRMAVLWEYDEYSDEEISEITGVSVKTVKEWREGRRFLRLYSFERLTPELINERTGICLETVRKWTNHTDEVNAFLKHARQQANDKNNDGGDYDV